MWLPLIVLRMAVVSKLLAKNLSRSEGRKFNVK
jgi:hypothetical protein